MKILNKKTEIVNETLYTPHANLGGLLLRNGDVMPDDQIHITGLGTWYRKNKREGDYAITYHDGEYRMLRPIIEKIEKETPIFEVLENADLSKLDSAIGYSVVKDKTRFGYHEMSRFARFPLSQSKSANHINAPKSIEYACEGITSEDCAWFAGKAFYFVPAGTQITYAIN